MKTKSKTQIIKFEADQVAGGYNINIVRKAKNDTLHTTHRIARFGAELCQNEEDKPMANIIARDLVKMLNEKFTSKT